VDTNRAVWNELAGISSFDVDAVVPINWESNLIKNLSYQHNPMMDSSFQKIYSIPTYLKGNGSFYFFSPLKLYKTLSENSYEHIIMAQETWSLSLLILNIIKSITKNKNTPIHLWVCQNIKKKNLYWLRHFERLNCKTVKNIMCCCQEIADVIKWKGINRRCLYFPFSFEGSHYHLKPFTKKENLIFGYLGRFGEEKGLNILIKAFKKFNQKYSSSQLILQGAGPLKDTLLAAAKDNPQIIVKDPIPHNEAHTFYQKIDVFILPSETRSFWKEQFGRVLIESAASGCVIAGSDSGAIPEVLSHLQSPYVFQEGDEISLVEQMIKIQKDYQLEDMPNKISLSSELSFKLFENKSVAKRIARYLQEKIKTVDILLEEK